VTKTDFNGLQVDAFGNLPIAGSYGGGDNYNYGTLPSDVKGRRTAGAQYSASVMWGKTFDRGHVLVALDYYHQNELARGDRKYLNCPEAYVFRNGSHDRADLIDPRTGKFHCEDLPVGQVWTYDYEYNYFTGLPGNLNVAGIPKSQLGGVVLMQYQYPGENLGIPTLDGSPAGCGVLSCFGSPPGWFPTGYDGPSQAVQNDFNPFAHEQTIIPKTTRYTIYADAAYELTDHVEAYAEFLANRRKTYQNGWRQFWTFGFTSSGSYCALFDCSGTGAGPYTGNNASYWASGWTGLNFLSPTAVTNRGSDSKQKVDYWRGVGGIRGDFGSLLKGWSYDAYIQYSHNKGLYSNEQVLQDVIDTSSFQTASCVGTVTPVSHKQCIDLPWTDPYFLFGQFTPEQAAFLFDWETGKTVYKQVSGEATMTGNLIDLPAGAVGVALGLSARRDEIVDTPGDITIAGNAWGASTSGITAGHSMTTEAFGEIRIPILKDEPLFKDLSFSGAARITNVKNTRRSDGFADKDNGNWTYKVGGNWAVNNWLRFRGTYGTSFRAPALFEEFKADETSFPSARTIDPCVQWGFNLGQGNISQRIADNCAADGIPSIYGGGSISATVHSSGGIGLLDPETSTALTGSIILTPRFSSLPNTRFSLAIDYFRIKVKSEVSQLGAQNIIFGCYDSDSFPTDPLCSLFDRGTLGTDPFAIGNVHDSYINIASQVNKGVDFTALIQQGLGRWGSLSILGNATYQLKDRQILLPNSPAVDNNGDIGDPKFVADINATWKPHGGWTFFWGTEIYGKASNEGKFKDRHGGSLCQVSAIWGNYCVKVSVPTTFYHAASVTKEFGDAKHKLEVTLGMRNIFDTKPPRVSTIGGGGLPQEIGPVVGTSQYDFLGRRVFFNISKKF